MIITCPACSTRYDVPEGAIGGEGRTVRCAQCRHSWSQPGPQTTSDVFIADPGAPLAAEAGPAALDAGAAQGAPAAPLPAASGPAPAIAASASEERYTEAEKPRGRGKSWLLLAALFVLLVLAIGGALTWFGKPDWLPFPHTALATKQDGLALNFPSNLIERKTLGDGTEFFGARGTVTNTSATSRAVPPIEIVLRDAGKRIVYRWEVVPPKRQLAPGESMTVTEAVTDIPKSATVSEIGWKAG